MQRNMLRQNVFRLIYLLLPHLPRSVRIHIRMSSMRERSDSTARCFLSEPEGLLPPPIDFNRLSALQCIYDSVPVHSLKSPEPKSCDGSHFGSFGAIRARVQRRKDLKGRRRQLTLSDASARPRDPDSQPSSPNDIAQVSAFRWVSCFNAA